MNKKNNFAPRNGSYPRDQLQKNGTIRWMVLFERRLFAQAFSSRFPLVAHILCALVFSDRPRRFLKILRARAPQVDLLLKSPAPTNNFAPRNGSYLRDQLQKNGTIRWMVF